MPPFIKLWSNHPNVTGEPLLLDKKVYENQCAINLSAALLRSGVNLKSYTGTWSWEGGKPKYAIRAHELAEWLASPVSGVPAKVERYSGKEDFGEVEGKRGIEGRSSIVFFQNYWGTGAQADHIDLWNGFRLTDTLS